MRSLSRSAVLAIFALYAGKGAAQLPPVSIDQSAGSVKGMTAVGIWPQLPPPAEKKPRDPKGFEVVAISLEDSGKRVRFPAGTWQILPNGEYAILLEGNSRVSPSLSTIKWTNEPFQGKGFAVMRLVVDAGRVQLKSGCPSDRCEAWMLHESSNVQSPVPYLSPEMLRREALGEAQKSGILMPAGRVAVAVYDSSAKSFVALGSPVNVSAFKTVVAQPRAPANSRSGLILELTRPSMTERRTDDDVTIALVTAEGKNVPAPFVTRTHRKIIAVWNDLPSGEVSVNVQSARVRLPERQLRLRSGRIEHVSTKLAPVPKLAISFDLPEGARVFPYELAIVDQSGQSSPVLKELPKGTDRVELDVAAAPLEVRLAVGPWEITERIDLTSGRDGSVVLAMRLIRLTGRVLYGDDPAKATLTFETRKEWDKSLTVTTDNDGRFEALFSRPQSYFGQIVLDGRAPYMFGIDVLKDGSHEFRIPANEYRFTVNDQQTGRAIEGAKILIENKADDEEGMSTNQRLVTNSSGEAIAQPLRLGTMRATARAERYTASDTHEEVVVSEGQRQIAFKLEPETTGGDLQLLLPGGAPATGAEVTSHERGPGLWVVRADDKGRVELPETARGSLLLIRTPGAAFLARRWTGETSTWTLERPAEPLQIRGVRADGKAAPFYAPALWIDGLRVSGPTLGWLTSSSAATDSAGLWTVHGLPPRSVEVLLWRSINEAGRLAARGMLDNMRTPVPYPWPAVVSVKVVE